MNREIKDLTLNFHYMYEKLAPVFGYETREDTKKFDFNSPNGKLMYKTVKSVMEPILKENQQLKEQLNKYTDPEDLTLMFMYCDEKAKDKIKCLEQENQQLKEHLHQKEDIIDKVIKWIENDYYSMNTTDIDSILVRNNKLVQIRKFLKGDK